MAKKRKRGNKPRNQRKPQHEQKLEDPGFCNDEELVGGENGGELSEHQEEEFTDPVRSFNEQDGSSGEQDKFSDEFPGGEFFEGEFSDDEPLDYEPPH